jgi:hypothetical protein
MRREEQQEPHARLTQRLDEFLPQHHSYSFAHVQATF